MTDPLFGIYKDHRVKIVENGTLDRLYGDSPETVIITHGSENFWMHIPKLLMKFSEVYVVSPSYDMRQLQDKRAEINLVTGEWVRVKASVANPKKVYSLKQLMYGRPVKGENLYGILIRCWCYLKGLNEEDSDDLIFEA